MAALLEFRLQKYHLSIISDTGNFSWIFVIIDKGLGYSQFHTFRNVPFLEILHYWKLILLLWDLYKLIINNNWKKPYLQWWQMKSLRDKSWLSYYTKQKNK